MKPRFSAPRSPAAVSSTRRSPTAFSSTRRSPATVSFTRRSPAAFGYTKIAAAVSFYTKIAGSFMCTFVYTKAASSVSSARRCRQAAALHLGVGRSGGVSYPRPPGARPSTRSRRHHIRLHERRRHHARWHEGCEHHIRPHESCRHHVRVQEGRRDHRSPQGAYTRSSARRSRTPHSSARKSPTTRSSTRRSDEHRSPPGGMQHGSSPSRLRPFTADAQREFTFEAQAIHCGCAAGGHLRGSGRSTRMHSWISPSGLRPITSDAQQKVTFWVQANHVGFAQRERAPLIKPCADGLVYSIAAASSHASRLTGLQAQSSTELHAERAVHTTALEAASRAGSQRYPGGISDRCVLTP